MAGKKRRAPKDASDKQGNSGDSPVKQNADGKSAKSKKTAKTDELRDSISAMMAELERERVIEAALTGRREGPANLCHLPGDCLAVILAQIGDESNYTAEQLGLDAKSVKHGFMREAAALKKMYRLRSVCRQFNNVLMDPGYRLPRFPIGMRITPKHAGGDPLDNRVMVYRYGGPGSVQPCVATSLDNLATVTFPCKVTTNLTVKGLPLDDDLVEALINIELSEVEEVYIVDIPCVDLSDPGRLMTSLLIKCASACTMEFYGSGYKPVEFGDYELALLDQLEILKGEDEEMSQTEMDLKTSKLRQHYALRLERSQRKKNENKVVVRQLTDRLARLMREGLGSGEAGEERQREIGELLVKLTKANKARENMLGDGETIAV